MEIKSKLMDESALRRALMRIAHEITERNRGTQDLVLIGIRRRGALIAHLIAENMEKIEGTAVPCADLDISHYRDDTPRLVDPPLLSPPCLPFPVKDKKIILVDDVLYTGRTVRAAIEAIFEVGRPQSIQLAILIDRGHRELPFRADYVGKNVPTARHEKVKVMLPPYDEETAVVLVDNSEFRIPN